MQFPCNDCITLSMCDRWDWRTLEKCDLVWDFLNKYIFDIATKRVQKNPGQLGFHGFILDHPSDNKKLLELRILAHPDRIYLRGIVEVTKVQQ